MLKRSKFAPFFIEKFLALIFRFNVTGFIVNNLKVWNLIYYFT